MSLILLLLVVILWMAGQTGGHPPQVDLRAGLAGFFGFYVVLILLMGIWSRALVRRVAAFNAHLSLRRFHKMMLFARVMIPVAFGLGVFWLGWGWVVNERLGAMPAAWPVKLPNVVIGIAPAILAWMGLWWSQYPADRALREQNLLLQLEADLPVHAPPRLLRYIVANFRLQVLFAILPVLMVIATRDLIVIGVRLWDPSLPITDTIDSVASMVALAVVYVFAPEMLRRVLDTRPLPNGALRRRLEDLCDRTGVRAREILLWRTNGLMGNAAVMGLFPRVRYVLMTDLLLETMTDEQIEAVFAHEVGHVRHRHMLWYVALIVSFALLSMGPGDLLDRSLRGQLGDSQWLELAQVLGGLVLFWLGFGFVSRRFERQADVYAARTVQHAEDATPLVVPQGVVGVPGGLHFVNGELADASTATLAPVLVRPSAGSRGSVGPYGAALFASALRRVAAVNNIPIHRREWIHGSIEGRMDYVKWLAGSPDRTRAFDRYMLRLYATLVLLVASSAALLWAIPK